jgi:RNA polymerase sigma-70 factor (ECF subfamily)
MLTLSADRAFTLYQRTRSPRALAWVFDGTAPELLRLARHLASSEAAAEDLVQATFVTAIEASASHRQGERVLPWLVGILGNHARAARRKARRALDAERAQREHASDPVAEAAQQELHAQVSHAIAALPDVYRPVLRLYLEQGLEPGEIAHSLERPPGTVRAQVHRGLELLRGALPAAVGARAALAAGPARGITAVRDAVLTQGTQTGVLAAATTSMGVLTIMNWKLLGAASAVAVAAFLTWQVSFGAGDAARQPADDPSASLHAGTPSALPQVSTAAGADAVRAPVPSPPAAPPATDNASLRVTVTRGAQQGASVEGIAVRLQPGAYDHRFDAEPSLTGPDGVVAFADLEPGTFWVRVDYADVRVPVEVAAGEHKDLTVRIPRGLAVTGRVLDATGQPVGGARVLAHAHAVTPDLVATTDARGRFQVLDLVSQIVLQARAAGHAPSLGVMVAGKPGESKQLDLALGARARRVSGTVREASGRPVPRARVGFAAQEFAPQTPGRPFPYPTFVRADDEGRFLADDVTTAAVFVVGIPHQGDAAAAPGVFALPAGNADADADVRLRRAATVRGRVSGMRKGPQLSVTAWAEQPLEPMGLLLNTLGMRVCAVGNDGRYQLMGMVPGTHRLQVVREQILATHTLDVAEGGEYEWDPALNSTSGLHLRITPQAPPREALAPLWMATLYRRAANGNFEFVNATAAGADGKVQFTAVSPEQPYDVVLAMTLGRGAHNSVIVAHLRDLVPQATAHAIALDATTLPSARLRGRLVDAHGTPQRGVTVVARTRVSEILLSHASVETGADGRFELGPLPPGPWTLLAGTTPDARQLGEHALAAGQSIDVRDVIR